MKKIFYLLSFILAVESAKILGIFHFPMRSMHNLGSALLKGLAKKGHQVTMVSPFPLKEPVENYTDIDVPGVLRYKEENTMKNLIGFNEKSSLGSALSIDQQMLPINLLALNSSTMQHLLSSKEKYDLVILCWIFNEAYLGIPDHLNAPTILFTTTGENSLVHHMYGDPGALSYVPHLFLTLTDEMTFWERVQNTVFSVLVNIFLSTVYLTRQNQVLKQYFPNARPVEQLMNQVPLIFLNTHYSFDYPRPHDPRMVNVGGLHMVPSKPLPQDIQRFLDEAPNGVVFFSLGSNVKSSQLPTEKLQIIINAFGKLNVKVLWKFETDLQGLPSNVLIKQWMPQNDVLAHPNIRCFITQGGLLSLTEAVYHGIPLVGMPFFGDQKHNVLKATKMGFAVTVNFKELTEEKLIGSIEEVLNNPKYKENVLQRSVLLRDQPMHPLDHAIYWVEYVLKHKNAESLRTGALKLHWYQYYLLDVIVFLSLVVIFFTVAAVYVLRTIRNFFPYSIKLKVE